MSSTPAYLLEARTTKARDVEAVKRLETGSRRERLARIPIDPSSEAKTEVIGDYWMPNSVESVKRPSVH